MGYLPNRSLGILIFVTFNIAGCGTLYDLPGHNESNEMHPPDIVLRVGERVRALHCGIELLDSHPMMYSDDNNIVAIDDPPPGYEVFLQALSEGTTRVHYDVFSTTTNPNIGFAVTVVPKDFIAGTSKRLGKSNR